MEKAPNSTTIHQEEEKKQKREKNLLEWRWDDVIVIGSSEDEEDGENVFNSPETVLDDEEDGENVFKTPERVLNNIHPDAAHPMNLQEQRNGEVNDQEDDGEPLRFKRKRRDAVKIISKHRVIRLFDDEDDEDA